MDKKINQDFIQIIKAGILAPSGDNTQPWKFRIYKNKIQIIVKIENDTSLYNLDGQASIIAIGAVIENMRVAATHYGYMEDIVLYPLSDDKTVVAEMVFTESKNIIEDQLYPFLDKRSANRKQYSIEKLPNEVKKQLETLKEDFEEVSFVLEDDRKKCIKIAHVASLNEKVVLENKKLHHFLFQHITWSEKEDNLKKGFYVKTLELKGPQKIAFKLFRNWNIMAIFNRIGMADFVAKDNEKIYSKSGAMVAFVANQIYPESFVRVGMLLERFWLYATKFGLGVQPLAGIPLLEHGVIKKKSEELSSTYNKIIDSAYNELLDIFAIDNGSIVIMLRVGLADRPSALTKRHDPEIQIME
jgi:Putative TM nitroreductase